MWFCENYEIGVKKKYCRFTRATVFYYPAALSRSCKPELGRIKIRFADYALSFHVETWSVARHSM